MTVQALARQRFGFQRLPVVTAVVVVVTATTSVLGLLIPGMLEALQRTPQGLHDDWWRTFTALFVQDGGVVGTISNLAFLLVMGVLAEQVLGGGGGWCATSAPAWSASWPGTPGSRAAPGTRWPSAGWPAR
jgi:hypothetical protein